MWSQMCLIYPGIYIYSIIEYECQLVECFCWNYTLISRLQGRTPSIIFRFHVFVYQRDVYRIYPQNWNISTKKTMKTRGLPLKLKSLNTSKPGLGAVVKNLEKVVEQLTTRSCNLIFNIRNYAVEKWFLWTSLDELLRSWVFPEWWNDVKWPPCHSS